MEDGELRNRKWLNQLDYRFYFVRDTPVKDTLMQYFTTTSKASRRAVDCVIVGIYERGKLGAGANDIDAASKGAIKRLIKSGDLSSQLGSCTVLNDVAGVRAARVAVVGLGKASQFGASQFRTAFGSAVRSVSRSKAKSVLNSLTLESVDDTSVY